MTLSAFTFLGSFWTKIPGTKCEGMCTLICIQLKRDETVEAGSSPFFGFKVEVKNAYLINLSKPYFFSPWFRNARFGGILSVQCGTETGPKWAVKNVKWMEILIFVFDRNTVY